LVSLEPVSWWAALAGRRNSPRPAVANSVQVVSRNCHATAKVDVEYPVGRNRRCAEAIVGDTS